MKVLNKILQIATVVFGLGVLVMFFLPFVEFATSSISESYTAAQFAFGAKVKYLDVTKDLALSAGVLCSLVVSVLASALSIVGLFKNSKGLRYAVSGISLFAAIFTLIAYLGEMAEFVKYGNLGVSADVEPKYTIFATIMVIAMFVFSAFSIGHLLVDDYIEAKATGKKTIFQRVVLFFRDYKSEINKIVWPSFQDVVKNTGIVLIMCAVVGALIWVVDGGLGKLIEMILELKLK